MATAFASLPVPVVPVEYAALPTALSRLVAYMVTQGYCTEDTPVSLVVTQAIGLLEEHRVCQRHWTRRAQTSAARAAGHPLLARVLALGVSQATLARTLGVSPATVSRWSTQARGIPCAMQRALASIAVALEQVED